jgi:hypothetical protein
VDGAAVGLAADPAATDQRLRELVAERAGEVRAAFGGVEALEREAPAPGVERGDVDAEGGERAGGGRAEVDQPVRALADGVALAQRAVEADAEPAGEVVVTAGELLFVASSWGLSVPLMPHDAPGEYQGVFATGEATAVMAAPALMTMLVADWGQPGWLVLAAIFLVPAVTAIPATRWALRTRPA